MIVGYSAGGGADALARLVASKLSDGLGQQVLVENRPGAGASIAAASVATSAADGYTLFFADTALLIAPAIYQKLTFDPVKSFTPVSGVVTTPLVIAVNNDVKARNIPELISILKSNAGRLSYGSPGVGTVHHLARRPSSARPRSISSTSLTKARRRSSLTSSRVRSRSASSARRPRSRSPRPAGYGRSRSRVPSKSPAPSGRRSPIRCPASMPRPAFSFLPLRVYPKRS